MAKGKPKLSKLVEDVEFTRLRETLENGGSWTVCVNRAEACDFCMALLEALALLGYPPLRRPLTVKDLRCVQLIQQMAAKRV
jgi:hypothetical protein